MSTVGQIEKKTQARVAKLFRDTLGYDYLGIGVWHNIRFC
jgi:type I restriction enzyme R subunit